ncbi:hypothetical protein B0H14DRAFT_3865728 [Mycena olivaceomarginata]|nr:hypothetical protein B0H14DRAFT_3865728 [Mycena olivaceomarginata]
MRPLSLHTSALNDAEYTIFTENLASLLDQDSDDPEAQTLTIREARAWMRGRYPGIPAATIDRILALFPSKDVMNGAEFFAALRLVLHVEAGKEVDRALAFVQVHPGSAVAAAPPVPASQGIAPAPENTPDTASIRPPQRHNPFLPASTPPSLTRSKTAPTSAPAPSVAPVLPPRRVAPPSAPVPPPRHPPLPPRSASPPKPSTPAHITSTLMKQSLQASKTGQWLKQGQARLESERVLQVLRSTSTTPRPAQSTSDTGDYMSASASSDGGSRRSGSRHAPSSIPPSTSSLEQVALASPFKSNPLQRAFDDAYRDREPPPTHPDQKRKSGVPPSSASTSSGSSRASARVHRSPQRSPQRSPEREKPRPPPKPRSLTGAPHQSQSQSPFASASPFLPQTQPQTPQTQTRLTRSLSLHPSPSPPPPTAAAASSRLGRARPESVHALLGGLGGSLRHVGAELQSPFGDPVHRRARGPEGEALVSRREADLSDSDSDSDDELDGADGDGGWVGVGRFADDSDVDGDAEPGGARPPRKARSQPPVRRDTVTPRDSLKWPVDVEGEGWKPL